LEAIVTDLPTGAAPDDLISIADLARIAGVRPTYYYAEARAGRAPRPKKGVSFAEAVSWLEGRARKKAAREDTLRRLREVVGVKEGRHADETA
jgi:hypothetical protein